ncbi:BglII/BstYI family type II restriction endonuclease [Megalodesulfovibrio gigas]|uniref:Restriction endonuclease BglII n=1 Tax=Megalodesulfovibrio gigas (strain ATCC 19364 / DSM 1382 / NCIMB 9332 / VKM B-1759) TaxID=1121448 RepID=T2G8K9_MEGG1|nr:BglII/BstYI family type II restriction endonuclease [Megalodesulfovibrio gigas]AGW12232.1 hypothetical protein DGI_0305 [Megalodesulfovibrio gigas DSM 1382 = ATCC 19364]
MDAPLAAGTAEGVGLGADAASEIHAFVPHDIRERYEVHSYKHAAAMLHTCHAAEAAELYDSLRAFRLTKADIQKPGGNESDIPKRFAELLRPQGWDETSIRGDLVVTLSRHKKREDASHGKGAVDQTILRKNNYLDGHKIDFVKHGVAFDLEWNSKDQTFDRDLYAFRAFAECGVIGVGILLTRSASLNPVFAALGVKNKYGASTTWMGKLLYRLNAGRHGGCPVLALGITPALIADWAAA